MVGAALMVMVNVLVAWAAAASWMVMLPLKVPVAEGVPVKPIVVPLSVAANPVGRPVVVPMIASDAVPPVTVIVPVKSVWPTVQADCVRLVIVGAALIVMVKVL